MLGGSGGAVAEGAGVGGSVAVMMNSVGVARPLDIGPDVHPAITMHDRSERSLPIRMPQIVTVLSCADFQRKCRLKAA